MSMARGTTIRWHCRHTDDAFSAMADGTNDSEGRANMYFLGIFSRFTVLVKIISRSRASVTILSLHARKSLCQRLFPGSGDKNVIL